MMPASNSNLCHDGNGLQLYLISSIPDTKKKQSFMSSRKKLDLLPQLEKILILGIKMWKLPKKKIVPLLILCISGWRGEGIYKTGEKDENLALFQTLCRILLNMARWGSRQLEGRIGGREGGTTALLLSPPHVLIPYPA